MSRKKTCCTSKPAIPITHQQIDPFLLATTMLSPPQMEHIGQPCNSLTRVASDEGLYHLLAVELWQLPMGVDGQQHV